MSHAHAHAHAHTDAHVAGRAHAHEAAHARVAVRDRRPRVLGLLVAGLALASVATACSSADGAAPSGSSGNGAPPSSVGTPGGGASGPTGGSGAGSTTVGRDAGGGAGSGSTSTSSSSAGPGGGGDPAAPTTSAPPAITAPTDTKPEPPLPANVVVNGNGGASPTRPITVRIDATPGSQVFGAEARLCKPDADVRFDADFRPTQMGQCVVDPLTPDSDAHVTVAFEAPFASGVLTFRPGAGTSRYTTQDGRDVAITCGPGNPCLLVIKVQVPGGFGFRTAPVTY